MGSKNNYRYFTIHLNFLETINTKKYIVPVTIIALVLKAYREDISFGFMKHLNKSARDESPILTVQYYLLLKYTVLSGGGGVGQGTASEHSGFPSEEITAF